MQDQRTDPGRPFLTTRQSVVFDSLKAEYLGEWASCMQLVNATVVEPCDPCDATGEGLFENCPACHGDGWRYLDYAEVEHTLRRLVAMGLVAHLSGLYRAPLPDPDDPLEKLWALEALRPRYP
jgi:hypothetical protein